MSNLAITQLWIYPVKSLGGIHLESSSFLQKGLRYDRRWMLVDDQNKFLTQRIHPMMALFKLRLDNDKFQITFQGHSISLDLSPSLKGPENSAAIWDDQVSVCEIDKDHSAWFSEMLQTSCKLVYFPETNRRPIDPAFQRRDEQVSLADAYPILALGQSSLDDLNSRLQNPVPMNRVRPNLVFTGGSPYEEDTWKDFTIGDNSFVGIKPCSRCILITTDQDTATRGTEPLKTLASYRSKNNKVYFGQNIVPSGEGEIKVGQSISVQSYL